MSSTWILYKLVFPYARGADLQSQSRGEVSATNEGCSAASSRVGWLSDSATLPRDRLAGAVSRHQEVSLLYCHLKASSTFPAIATAFC